MCGIAGIVCDEWDVLEPVISKMTDAMAHRGPDGRGIYIEKGFGLGHRRLAVLDTSEKGQQPMVSHCGRYIISYNGEVYNYKDIQAELGIETKTGTDTEIVLEAFARWGPECLKKFNGMFAFAVWDRGKGELFLARDRFGIKPIYIQLDDHALRFASEIKSILADEMVPRKVDPVALRQYFTFQDVFTGHTLFGGISILGAGEYLTYRNGDVAITRKWWKPEICIAEDVDLETFEQRLRVALEGAVKRQLVSDVPVGAHLSGGIDSGLLVTMASKHLPRLPVFTGGFDTHEVMGMEAAFDERPQAEQVSRLAGAEHYEIVHHPGDMQRVLDDLVWHIEDLRVGMSWQNWYVDRLASKFVKVCLAGTGGDELFGGYPWRYAQDHETYVQRLIPFDNSETFFVTSWPKSALVARDAYHEAVERAPWPPENTKLLFDLNHFLHGLLVVTDKIAMAHGLEVRVPFLDNEVVDLALSVPYHYKVVNGTGKAILRRVAREYLPKSVCVAKKQGFSPPDGEWYRANSTFIHDRLLKPSKLHDHIQLDAIRDVVEEHELGHDRRLIIWSLLSFEAWLRVFEVE